MKIQIASDLHLEWLPAQLCSEQPLPVAPGADLLVLAGDIHSGTAGVEAFRDYPLPVILVAGNHEAYGFDYLALNESLAQDSRNGSVHFLECSRKELPGLRVLGCTLWTDYALTGNPAKAQMVAGFSLTDHERIRSRGRAFSPQTALARHQVSRRWLKRELAKPFKGKTLVVTHHGCHPGGVAPKHQFDNLNPAFMSDLRQLMPYVDLWVHGHTHSSVELQEGRCRVICNPRGYPLNRQFARSFADLRFENPDFDPLKVVELTL